MRSDPIWGGGKSQIPKDKFNTLTVAHRLARSRAPHMLTMRWLCAVAGTAPGEVGGPSLLPPHECFRLTNTSRATTSTRAILPRPNSSWRPVCTISCCDPARWPRKGRYCPRCDRRTCAQAGERVGCCTSEKDGGTLLKGATKTVKGGWRLQASYNYFLDERLARELARLFSGSSVLELGAGLGCYTAALRDSEGGPAAVRGFDGAPAVRELSGGLVGEADLTTPLQARSPCSPATQQPLQPL